MGPSLSFLGEASKGSKFIYYFAYYVHHRPQDDDIYCSPKKITEAMGHEYETHLLSYARFDSKDLAKSFDQVPTSIDLNLLI